MDNEQKLALVEEQIALEEVASSVDGFSDGDEWKAMALCITFIAGAFLLVWAGNHYHWWQA